jgi:4-oxalocrotonate tautomerase
MPIARIDLRKGKDDAFRQTIGRIVYEAMLEMGVPEGDRFQVVAEHDATGFLFERNYLGIPRSDDLIMIQVTLNAGRTVDQKRAFYRAVADGLTMKLKVRQEDVLINLVEVAKENWSFGLGLATYAD